jgi:hypothetical protein
MTGEPEPARAGTGGQAWPGGQAGGKHGNIERVLSRSPGMRLLLGFDGAVTMHAARQATAQALSTVKAR